MEQKATLWPGRGEILAQARAMRIHCAECHDMTMPHAAAVLYHVWGTRSSRGPPPALRATKLSFQEVQQFANKRAAQCK